MIWKLATLTDTVLPVFRRRFDFSEPVGNVPAFDVRWPTERARAVVLHRTLERFGNKDGILENKA